MQPIFSAIANDSSVVPVLEHSSLNFWNSLSCSKFLATGWSGESARKEKPNKDYFVREYVENERTKSDIGRELGINSSTIKGWLKEYGIESRKLFSVPTKEETTRTLEAYVNQWGKEKRFWKLNKKSEWI